MIDCIYKDGYWTCSEKVGKHRTGIVFTLHVSPLGWVVGFWSGVSYVFNSSLKRQEVIDSVGKHLQSGITPTGLSKSQLLELGAKDYQEWECELRGDEQVSHETYMLMVALLSESNFSKQVVNLDCTGRAKLHIAYHEDEMTTNQISVLIEMLRKNGLLVNRCL